MWGWGQMAGIPYYLRYPLCVFATIPMSPWHAGPMTVLTLLSGCLCPPERQTRTALYMTLTGPPVARNFQSPTDLCQQRVRGDRFALLHMPLQSPPPNTHIFTPDPNIPPFINAQAILSRRPLNAVLPVPHALVTFGTTMSAVHAFAIVGTTMSRCLPRMHSSL